MSCKPLHIDSNLSMSDEEWKSRPTVVEQGIKEMKIKGEISSDEEVYDTIRVACLGDGESSVSSTGNNSPVRTNTSTTQSPKKKVHNHPTSPTPIYKENEEIRGSETLVKMEPGQPPKLARVSTQKVMVRSPQLFHDYEDKTQEAKSVFEVITQCSYSAKYLGATEHAMDCDCAEEWDATTKVNYACGDDSDCINRATKMECFGECGCGSDCQNQRFQRQQFANVTVIKTQKKGYGLRAEADLQPNDFVFEYIGEVIHEGQFRRRMIQYDEEGIKHFYFMSLSKGEFVDATKKGNLGRFCNHSCNPNCYVDKWVVGDKLRMGIFAERKIQAGEELVFNYNVDRYGADPQPCYCGEPNCTGFIGGKTQTERATKLSNTTIEALGIDDGDGWDIAAAKKPRKKKAGEDDEEYVNNVQPKSLDEDGVTKVMATLMQCKEKWIAVKLLGRIQQCRDERVINRVVKMHGYQILNSALSTWKEDFNVVLQILDILSHFPRITRNKISDSKIETTVAALKGCGDERVESQAAVLLKEWSTLETAYRIPRKKRDPNSTVTAERRDRFERRGSAREDRKLTSIQRSRSSSGSVDGPRGPPAPTGPRNNAPQRGTSFYAGSRPPYRPTPRPFNNLPPGWFSASSTNGTYYYNTSGQTQWARPTVPAAQPPPPPKPTSNNKALEDLINEITNAKANTPEKPSASAAPQSIVGESKKDKKQGSEKWRKYPEEKQKKLYENTLFPHVKRVMDKYKNKLPKDDLKRFAKEVSKKLVDSDFKNNRVDDPTRISSHQERQVKKYVTGFFEKAVAKKQEYDNKKAERKAKSGSSKESPTSLEVPVKKDEESEGDEVMDVSDDDDARGKQKSITPITPLDQIANGDGLKRKRELDGGVTLDDEESTPSKRARSITPPPPPPPPPVEGSPECDAVMEGSDTVEGEVVYDTSSLAGFTGTNKVIGKQMDIGDQTPPPPPLPIDLLAKMSSNGDSLPAKDTTIDVYDMLPTPGSFEDSLPDQRNENVDSKIQIQRQHLKAQQGV